MFRIQEDSLIYGPFYNGPAEGGLLMKENLFQMVKCNGISSLELTDDTSKLPLHGPSLSGAP